MRFSDHCFAFYSNSPKWAFPTCEKKRKRENNTGSGWGTYILNGHVPELNCDTEISTGMCNQYLIDNWVFCRCHKCFKCETFNGFYVYSVTCPDGAICDLAYLVNEVHHSICPYLSQLEFKYRSRCFGWEYKCIGKRRELLSLTELRKWAETRRLTNFPVAIFNSSRRYHKTLFWINEWDVMRSFI